MISKKSVRAILLAHSTHRGSGIAHRSWTSKLAEPHAEICYTPPYIKRSRARYGRYKQIHKASTVYYILGYDWIYQIPMSQERALSKRFSYVMQPHPRYPWLGSAMWSSTAKIAKIFQTHNNVLLVTFTMATALSFKEKKMTKVPLPDSVRIGQVSLAVFQTVIFFLKSIFFIFGLKIVSAV